MEQKASEIQKQRIKEIESAADRLVGKCKIMFFPLSMKMGTQGLAV